MSGEARQRWEAKARWHTEQRSLTPAEKIELILQLQLRESQLDKHEWRWASGRAG